MLIRNPGFTLISILALGLGIGANTAIFSVVNSILLRPLPFKSPEGLAMIWEKNIPRNRDRNVVSPANYLDWRDQNQSFEQIGAYLFTLQALNLATAGGEPERVMNAPVTSELFNVLGIQPAMGRSFAKEDDLPNAPRVVVLSHELWQRRFGGNSSILQQTISLHGRNATVIGIMPAGFRFPNKAECWTAIGGALADRGTGRFLEVVGRLKPGVSAQQAHAEMVSIAARLKEARPQANAGWTSSVVPLTEQVVGDVRLALLVLLAAVGFVLLIACANIANLLLARATSRYKEIAIRAALGAARIRVIRQLLTESLVLALCGGLAGTMLAYWGTRILIAMSPSTIPRLDEVSLDGAALAFTAAIAIMTGILFGIIPAIQVSRTNLQTPLKEGGKTSGSAAGRHWLRNALVVSETAIALILLVGAGLLFASFINLRDTPSGMDPDNVLAVEINLPGAKYPEARLQTAFFRDLIDRVRSLPSVQSAGAISFLPLAGAGAATGFTIQGRPAPVAGQGPVADVRSVTPDYFKAMGIRLLAGRSFDERDAADSKLAVIVNQTTVNNFWPDEDPLGKTLNMPWARDMIGEVVGVVDDVRMASLDAQPRNTLYWNHHQFPYGSMTLVIRTAGDPLHVAATVRNELSALDKAQPVASIKTMTDVFSESVSRPRFNTTLLMVFAGLALVLASLGIYGVMSFAVTQRTHEIGLRIALGARPSEVLSMVIGRGMILAGIGIVIGIAGSLALTRLMTTMLYQIRPTDMRTYLVVSALLAGIALVANYVPARRATRVDPLIALRHE